MVVFLAIVAMHPCQNLHHDVVYQAKTLVVISDFDFDMEPAPELMNQFSLILMLSSVSLQLKLKTN